MKPHFWEILEGSAIIILLGFFISFFVVVFSK